MKQTFLGTGHGIQGLRVQPLPNAFIRFIRASIGPSRPQRGQAKSSACLRGLQGTFSFPATSFLRNLRGDAVTFELLNSHMPTMPRALHVGRDARNITTTSTIRPMSTGNKLLQGPASRASLEDIVKAATARTGRLQQRRPALQSHPFLEVDEEGRRRQQAAGTLLRR